MNRTLVYSALIIILSLTADHLAHAWGRAGHQAIAEVGSDIVRTKGSFWNANSPGMGKLTNVPDQYWKSGPNAYKEKTQHWFQPDSYDENNSDQLKTFPRKYSEATRKYTEPAVISAGTAPWRIKQFYDLAVTAFRNRDYPRGLQLAGTMSHYIGDLSQPLHVSKNYDGQLTNNPGIHKFFETTNLEAANINQITSQVTSAAKKLLADPKFLKDFEGTLVDIVFNEIDRSFAQKDSVISTDISSHRNGQKLLALAIPRMADGAATLSIILEHLSKDAGLTDHEASVNVKVPDWIAPEFVNSLRPDNAKPSFYPQNQVQQLFVFLNGADCDQ